MTEQEAKTKWCPMVRGALYENDHVVAVVNSGSGEERYGRCVASECMMWRWQRHQLGDNTVFTIRPDGASSSDAPKPAQGGCGLAGPT